MWVCRHIGRKTNGYGDTRHRAHVYATYRSHDTGRWDIKVTGHMGVWPSRSQDMGVWTSRSPDTRVCGHLGYRTHDSVDI